MFFGWKSSFNFETPCPFPPSKAPRCFPYVAARNTFNIGEEKDNLIRGSPLCVCEWCRMLRVVLFFFLHNLLIWYLFIFLFLYSWEKGLAPSLKVSLGICALLTLQQRRKKEDKKEKKGGVVVVKMSPLHQPWGIKQLFFFLQFYVGKSCAYVQ